MTDYKILISDPISEEGIFPLRQAEGITVEFDTELDPVALAEKIAGFDSTLR